jgi:hypothetical protein
MTDAVGVITGFYFYLKNGAGWHADSITTGYLFVNVFFSLVWGIGTRCTICFPRNINYLFWNQLLSSIYDMMTVMTTGDFNQD